MAFAKRIFVFFLINILIITTISIVLAVLGVQPYLTRAGIDYSSLLTFCLVWGFGGSFISLALSRTMAKWTMGVELIPPDTRDSNAAWLVQTVHSLAKSAGLHTMPEVGIYNNPEVNAFATGPSKSRALVAVSSGLFNRMNREQIEGVLGHEISHVANGDMVTMTLIQGLVNTFVMFFARVAAWALSQTVDENKRGMVNMFAVFFFEIAFMFLGMFVIAFVSRAREYRADAGSARLAGREKMIHALQALRRSTELVDTQNSALATLKISGSRLGGLLALLSTHPSLDDRIQRLQRGAY